MMPVRKLFVLLLFIIVIIFSCKKESFTTASNAFLQTSVDSLHFDTVFTTTGSITQFIKIVNDNNKGIKVNSVRLAGGSSSFFKINVDGNPGPQVNNVEIGANDSAYVFVTVSINPNAANLPFIVQDSIEISYNGNRKWVQLDAYGQNARFLRNYEVRTNETWNNNLPYVLLGRFTIDTNTTLTINKGCRVYMHADAPFIVHGTLQVNGEKWDSTRVVFAGDRLDVPYKNFPAGYPGFIFTDVSKNNSFTYATIKNAYQGIVVLDPAPNAGPKITFNQTIIDNAFDAGILSINSSISAKNLLVSNCGKNIILAKGGTYDFTHCTVVSISNNYIQHKEPVLFISDYIRHGNVITTAVLNATFRNCIFWSENNGIVPSEVVVEKKGNTNPQILFDNVLWRVENIPTFVNTLGNVINNQNPLFDSINVIQRFYNFRLKIAPQSPAIDKGNNITIGTFDLDNKQRINIPDLGCYERN